MKQMIFSFLFLFLSILSFAQPTLALDPALAPFHYGVASGDPLSDRAIIWTRVSSTETTATVDWKVANDPEMTDVVISGTETTNTAKDYIVKVDAIGLQPDSYYYYQFTYNSQSSITGRTKTTPTGDDDNIKFALVSCNSYHWGYFNIFDRIADLNDLDAVIHVGDYIYEYEVGRYADPTIPERDPLPVTEIVSLDDYRTRYKQYRLDPDLMRAHQQHPFIVTWDDHEITNDTWIGGAENHNPGEGDFQVRKAVATQVYFEWMPIRDNGSQQVYRSFSYGNLADVMVLDTRHEGRTIQPTSMEDADFNDDRTLLGTTQKQWLKDGLINSTAKWKIVAQQVMMAPFNVGFAATNPTDRDQMLATESIFLDIWDGYPAERAEIFQTIADENIDNVVVLSGDIHTSFANDLTAEPVLYPLANFGNLPVPSPTYDPTTGEGAVAVEFVTPSVSSANFDENIGAAVTAQFEFAMNNDLELPPGSGNTFNYNPHIKFNDLDRNGFTIIDLKSDRAQGNFYYVPTVQAPNDEVSFETAFFTADGDNHLSPTATESAPKPVQAAPAPDRPATLATARVQLIHNAANQTVKVNINGNEALGSFAYLTATPYLDLPAGEMLNIELVPVGGPVPSDKVINFSAQLQAGATYVATVYGTFDETDTYPVELALLKNGREQVGVNEVGVQFFHGVPDAPVVKIDSDGDNIIEATAYGNFASDYFVVPAATYPLNVKTETDDEVANYSGFFDFWKERTLVVFATGSLAAGTFQPWVALSNGGTYPLPQLSSFSRSYDQVAQAQEKEALFTSIKVYPNPVRSMTNIKLRVVETIDVQLNLLSADGRLIRNLRDQSYDAGTHKMEISVDDLATGIYFIQAKIGDQIRQVPMVKQR